MLTATELLERLEDAGERRGIEAKRDLGEATEETVCAFVNEPDLGGGYILFGVEEMLDGAFRVAGVLLFGKKPSLRRLLPAQIIDYIRVAGTTWVPSVDARYEDAREYSSSNWSPCTLRTPRTSPHWRSEISFPSLYQTNLCNSVSSALAKRRA